MPSRKKWRTRTAPDLSQIEQQENEMLGLIDRVTTGIASVLLFFTVILTLCDVVGRNILSHPIPGATELTELALVGITFLVYPRVAFARQHIVIDLFDQWMGVTAKRLQQMLAGTLGAVLFGAIGWRLLTLADRAQGYGDVTGYLKLPVYPALYFMAVFAGLTALGFAATVVLAVISPASEFEDNTHTSNPGLE
jgi:TRAP-type C4-dicarboxylate transport system permease small subunit